jgi:hypothetical protein
MCDFLHRGIVLAGPRERADDLDVLVGLLDEAIG